MKLTMISFQLLLVVSATFFDIAFSESDTLVFLHVLFRHGSRTPDRVSLFPTDPHLNETYEPFGYSQLTTKGKKTEYDIGRYLRQTYGDFIPAQYTPNVVYAISTNFKRTKMSLELVLAGLFPPLETDIFSEGLNWQPIPFNVEEGEELIAIPLVYCPNFVTQYYKFMLSLEGKAILDSYQNLYQQLSNYTGLEITTPDEIVYIFETLQCEKDYGFELPDWTSDVFPEILEEAASLYFELATATPGLKRLANGHFLKKILEDSLAKTEGTLPEERKISLYSAHDYQIATLLNTLGLYDKHVPPFGSALIFEIHNIEGVYGIKLYYRDYTEATPKLLTLPGCSSFCELDKFTELVAEHFPGIADMCTYTGELM